MQTKIEDPNSNSINIIITGGVSYFDGMASSTRVRNLFEPLIEKQKLRLHNLIFKKSTHLNLPERGILNNVNYEVIEVELRKLFSFFKFYKKGFRFIRENKDKKNVNIAYHYSNINIKTIAFLIYAKIKGFKVVLDITEDSRTFINATNFMERLRNRSSDVFIYLVPYIADHIVVISSTLQKRLKKIAKNIPVDLIPVTVNFKYFPSIKAPESVPTAFNIFYGGSFSKDDGMQYLIDAFDSLCYNHEGIKLIITGRSTAENESNLMELINKSKFSERIDFKGYLDTDEYYNVLNGSHIFCMTRIDSPKSNSGFPFKLAEFLASGKAVVATNVSDVSLYLKNKTNSILISPNSEKEIEEGIEYLITNPSEIYRLGKAARATAEEHFDTEVISSRLFSIFSSLVKKNKKK